MKSNFDINEHLAVISQFTPIKFLEDELDKHDNFAIMAMSTTGLNSDNGFNKHTPIKIMIQEYNYNSETKQYVEGFCFSRLIECSREALDVAIANRDKYDVFKEGGIDLDDYTAGKNVVSKQQFKADFINYIQNLNPDIKFMIVNAAGNTAPFIREGMRSLSIKIHDYTDDNIMVLNKNYTNGKEIPFISQVALTRQYFFNNGYETEANSLPKLNQFLAEQKGKKEIIDYLEENYKGTDLRIREIFNFVHTFGEDIGTLEAEQIQVNKENLSSEKTDTVQIDKEDIPAENKEHPSNILKNIVDGYIQTRDIDPQKITDRYSNSELNKLFRIVEGQKNNEGLTVIKAITTGDKFGNKLMAVSLLAVSLQEDGTLKPSGKSSFKVQMEPELVDEIFVSNKSYFDEYGISINDFKNNTKALPEKEIVTKISNYFKNFPIDKYPLISDEHINDRISRTQSILAQLGNLPEFSAETIDIEKAFKEYLYLAINDKNYKQNVVVRNPESYSKDSMNVRTLISNNGFKPIGIDTESMFIGVIVKRIAVQQKELFPVEFEKKTQIQDKIENDVPQKEPKPKIIRPEPVPATNSDRTNITDRKNLLRQRMIEKQKKEEEERIIAEQAKEEERKTKEAEREKEKQEKANSQASRAMAKLYGRSPGGTESKPSVSSSKKPSVLPSGLIVESSKPTFEKIISSKIVDSESPNNSEVPASNNNLSANQGEKFSVLSKSTETNGQAIEAITLLVQAVIEQNKVISIQQESFQNTIANILNHQMKMIEEISLSSKDELHNSYSSETKNMAVSHLQKIKEEISIVADNVSNPKINEALAKANENLEKGQNILNNLIDEEKNKNQPR